MKVYPYAQGGAGTSVGDAARGRRAARCAGRGSRDGVRRGERERVQHDPAERLRVLRADERGWSRTSPPAAPTPSSWGSWPRSASSRASRSSPTSGCARILEDAAAVGNATSRALFFDSRAVGRVRVLRRDSAWINMLWVGGYTFETPPPLVTPEGIKPFPATGVRKLALPHAVLLRGHRRLARDVHAAHRASGRSTSWPSRTPTETPSTARETYQVTLPPDIPAARFWSFTALRQRDPLDARRHRSASRAPGASPTRRPAATANADGSTTVTFGPEQPGRHAGGQLDPDDGGQGLVPDPAPLQPARSRSSTRAGGRARSSSSS